MLGGGRVAERLGFLISLAPVFLAGSACRGRDATGPDASIDVRAWAAPPGIAPADRDSLWARRVLGGHHDFVRYLDEPSAANHPTLRIVFERVRGRIPPSEQRVTLFALGGPNCSIRGGCRDRLTLVAGLGVGEGDPIDEGWVLFGDIPGGEVYAPADADEPLLFRFEGAVLTAYGGDASRLLGVISEIGAPPPRVRLGPTVLALHEHTGGYYFRADPQAGHGRGVLRSASWLTATDGVATINATVFEAPHLAAQAAQSVSSVPTIEGPSGAVVQQAGALLVTRAEAILNVEQLFRQVATPDVSDGRPR